MDFKKFCKKPLIIIALTLMGVSLLGLFIMICIPKGKTYVYKYEVGTIQYEYKIELGDKFVESHTYIDENGTEYSLQTVKNKEYDYEINAKDGKIIGYDEDIEDYNITNNKGINNATGDYILNIDSDDKLYDNRVLEDLKNFIELNEYPDIIYTGFEMINHDSINKVHLCIYNDEELIKNQFFVFFRLKCL